MKIFITGIAGFIGSHLALALHKKGHNVSGVDDLSAGKLSNLDGEKIKVYQKNIANVNYFENIGNGFDTIIHAASRKIPRYSNPEITIMENTLGMINVVNHAKKCGAKIIFLSTSDIYGRQTDFRETANSIIGNPIYSRWTYTISKRWGEQLLYSNKFNKFNIIRLFGTYGPKHALSWTAGPHSVFISQALKKEPITLHDDGTQTRCFQYIDDTIDGIIKVLESDYDREIFNIGNPDEEISIYDLGKMIWNEINPGKGYKINYIPSSDKPYQEIFKRVPNINKAIKMLGFKPKISLIEGIKRTIEWQRKIENGTQT